MTADASPFDLWLSALAHSQRRLSTIVTPLTVSEIEEPSFASEWSIAQVLSHLGSGAEIFTLFLRAGCNGEPAPGPEEFQPLWERWNAKTPQAQVRDALHADATFLEQLDALDEPQRRDWRLSLFGTDQDLRDLLRLRLGEHAVHTWDIAVTRETDATITADAVELLIDTLGHFVNRVGKHCEQSLRVQITTHEPDRSFVLCANSEGVDLQSLDHSTGDDIGGTLRMPAEAFIRLVYGRLDSNHTPTLTADGIDFDVVRGIFPGF